MRIIFQFLSRRWLGASGWVYVFSLALAVLMYWLLPVSSLIHRWTLNGPYHIDDFSKVDRRSIIVSQVLNREERFQLDTITGAIKRFAATGEESQRAISSQKLPYQLMYSKPSFRDSLVKLTLKNERNGTERSLSCNDSDLEVAYIYPSSSSGINSFSLSPSGLTAMSSNERWLILQSIKVQSWVWLIDWLTERTGWSPTFLPRRFRNTAFIVDLQMDLITSCDLSAKYDAEIIFHPDNTGYIVHDLKRAFLGSPDPASEETIISWYALPPGPGHHSRNQWLLIVGTFLTPILLAMFLHLIRRTRPASFSSASK